MRSQVADLNSRVEQGLVRILNFQKEVSYLRSEASDQACGHLSDVQSLQSSLHEAHAVNGALIKQLSEEEQQTQSLSTQVCALDGKLQQATIEWDPIQRPDQAAQGREQSLKMNICRAEHMRLMSHIDCGAKIVQGLVTQTGTDYLAAALAQASASKGAGILSYVCERAAAERNRESERVREVERIHDRELESTAALQVLQQERLQTCWDLENKEKKHAQEIAKERERCQLLECKLIGESVCACLCVNTFNIKVFKRLLRNAL